MPSVEKRKADPTAQTDSGTSKKLRSKRKWTIPRRDAGDDDASRRREIGAGDVGIWATCSKGREGKCVVELRDLFQEYAEQLYGSSTSSNETKDVDIDDGDVDAELARELSALRKPVSTPLFSSIKLDTPCLIFFRVSPLVDPVSFVHRICKDATEGTARRQSRSAKRLTPMALIGKATEAGLAEVAQQVLAPHFHTAGVPARKYAIRPNIRNHQVLNRDGVIKQVASIVGSRHPVDLKSYDHLILVEVYKNICGVSVVGADYDQLKKYNIAELFESTPKVVTSDPMSIADSKPGASVVS